MVWCAMRFGGGGGYAMFMSEFEGWMKRALELATEAAVRDEVPVGALIFNDDGVVAESSNRREEERSPFGHAEMSVIDQAARKLGRWRLSDCTLVTTLEPCVMCAGTILQARLKTVVYGASDPKGGAESLFGLLTTEKLNHRLNVVSGVYADEGAALLTAFFKAKRAKAPQEA